MILAHYQCFSADDAVGSVLRALADQPSRFLTIVRNLAIPGVEPNLLYYTRRVDAGFLRTLRACSPETPLGRALDLHENDATMRPARPGSHEAVFSAPKDLPRATVMQALVGVGFGLVGMELPSLAPQTQALYPNVTCSHKDVSEGDEIAVTVSLSDRATELLAPKITVMFPAGVAEIDVLATVSDVRGFSRPEGQEWSHVFAVKRGAKISTPPWVFRAQVLASELYEMTITFFSGAAPVGHVTLTLPPADRPSAMTSTISVEPIALRPPRRGMSMVIRGAVGGYEIELSETGKPASETIPWTDVNADMFAQICNSLEAAQDRAEVLRQGKAVWLELPREVQRWLCHASAMGAPLTIHSKDPILPFEATVLADVGTAASRPILGVDRPVMRWIGKQEEPETSLLDVAKVACIRPAYAQALTGAIAEEDDLKARVADALHVGTTKELEALLEGSDVPLLHFAGHAMGAPNAGLQMDAGLFQPLDFVGTELMSRARPFVFLNACRAGFAQPGMFAAFASFPRSLLAAHASGLLVSVIQVNVDAAPIAARTFYEALGAGANVGEAVRRVREKAITGDTPAHSASYLSYLAYASPDLALRLRRPPNAS